MAEFKIKLAGQVVCIQAQYPYIKEYCKDYLCDEPSAFKVETTPADIEFEREKSARDDINCGKPVMQYSGDYLETLAVYRKLVEKMLSYDAMLFHGSAIAVDGTGYLFTATSGTGKSTHSRFWRETFGERAVMVNDDKPLLKLTENGVLVCGTPWNGKHRLGENIMVPLQAICILERGEKNEIEEITAQEALPMLMQQSHRPANPLSMATYLGLMDRLTKSLRFYRLRCTPDPEAATVAFEGMRPK